MMSNLVDLFLYLIRVTENEYIYILVFRDTNILYTENWKKPNKNNKSALKYPKFSAQLPSLGGGGVGGGGGYYLQMP